ncbi:hypothetical protein ANCDUO_23232 [Ancylostoma duodenale]|uniref:Uncharacterized protein n=1 Tax=Ancylostoma duodenale TaxID=51022 RepID=A0A0C2BS74_9BILA|nr:hypothetical protein ANCDUO_23232 [Ancylostoma duodenale]
MDDFAMFGVNISNNNLTDDAKLDYEIGVNYFAAYTDYIVINVSSPESLTLLSVGKKYDLQKVHNFRTVINLKAPYHFTIGSVFEIFT